MEGALWELQVPVPSAELELDREVLTGDRSSYRACKEEAHRLREAGHSSLRAPSAALLLGHAEVSCVAGGKPLGDEGVRSPTLWVREVLGASRHARGSIQGSGPWRRSCGRTCSMVRGWA